MSQVANWVEYPAPAGSTYNVTLQCAGVVATKAILGVLVDVFNARPSVTVTGNKIDSNGDPVIGIRVGADAPLGSMLGQYFSDDVNFWQITQVDRTDDGSTPVLDTQQVADSQVARAVNQTVSEAGNAVGSVASSAAGAVLKPVLSQPTLIAVIVAAIAVGWLYFKGLKV